MKMNKHYNELKASYLFVDIAHKVAAYQEAHPEKEIIRLGIGDVTQPLAKCVVQAMRDAAAEMGAPSARWFSAMSSLLCLLFSSIHFTPSIILLTKGTNYPQTTY